MPQPKPKESKSSFISRCVIYPDMRGKTREQKLGECYGIWREHHEGKEASADLEKTQPATGVKQDEENRAVAAALRKKRNDGRLKKAADFLAAYRKAKLLCQEGGAGPVEDVAGTAKGGKKCGGECACAACTEKHYGVVRTKKGWVTLEPSGTHVYIDGDTGDITAGPSHLTGKKPSQMSGQRVGKQHGEKHPVTGEPGPGKPQAKPGHKTEPASAGALPSAQKAEQVAEAVASAVPGAQLGKENRLGGHSFTFDKKADTAKAIDAVREAGWVPYHAGAGFVQAFPAQEVEMPKVAYHVVKARNLDATRKNGLKPAGVGEYRTSESLYVEGKVFLVNNEKDALRLRDHFGKELGEDYALVEIDTSKIKGKAYDDTYDNKQGFSGHIFTPAAIPADAIRLYDSASSELRKKRNDGRLKKAADSLAAYRKAKLLCQEGGAGPVEDVAGTAKGGKKGCGGECACAACTEKNYGVTRDDKAPSD